MGPEPLQRHRRRRADVPVGRGSDQGRTRRLVVGASLALALALAPTTVVARSDHPAGPGGPGVTDAPGPRDWIVTLEPGAVAPDGVGVSARRYRLDTASGRVAARGRAERADTLIERLERRRDLRVGARFGWAMQGFTAVMTTTQAAALRADPSVASVVPNAPASIAGEDVPLGITRIGAADGLTAGRDTDIDVAVLDTGVGPVGGPSGSPELDIRGGTDCRPGRSKPYADAGSYADGHGHGTHVAGTIAARANGVGVVGVAPGARIWSARVFDSSGSGTTASVICGIEWVTRWLAGHPGRTMVVNMSLRGPDDYHGPRACDANGLDARDPEHQAICTAARAGAVFAVAAGNESDEASRYIPARYAEVVTVAAMSDFDGQPGARSGRTRLAGCSLPTGTEHDDRFASYSNYGSAVDVVAPGTCVESLAPGGGSAVRTTFMTGTSMATPHVTGTIARYLATRPGAATDVAARLQGAGSLDWQASTDPRMELDADATPLRLVDAGALLSPTPGLRGWARRSVLTVGQGVTHRTVMLELQRVGGLAAGIDLSVDGLPRGVSVVGGPSIAGIRGELVLDVDGTAAEGDHRLAVHAEGGGVATDVPLTLRVDREAPDVAGARPRISLGKGGTYDGSATVRIAWSATDLVSGVERTELQRRRGGGWVRVARAQGSGAVALSLHTGSSARFRIVARDRAGNSATSPVLSTRLVVRDSAGSRVSWTGPWRIRHVSSASGRSVRTARGAGAQATLRFTGRAVAVVAPRGPGRGSIDVTIDGVRMGSARLSASRSQARRVVFASGALPAGEHVITVRTRKAGAELDAILVLE